MGYTLGQRPMVANMCSLSGHTDHQDHFLAGVLWAPPAFVLACTVYKNFVCNIKVA